MAFRHALFVFSPQGMRVLPRNAHLGGYGILAIPTPPSANPPTEFTEFTEISGVEEPPTDFADAHRWLGCVGFCGKIVWWLRGYGRMPYPPTIAQTGGLKFCVFCAICGRISQQERSVSICAICGRISQQKVSVSSANSVGGCSIAWLVQWRPLHPLGGCVGMAGMPYPPIIAQTGGLKFCVFCAICGRISQQEISVSICDICGRISQQEVSVGSANSVGGYARFAWLVQWRPLHPLVECKKCIDFFVVTNIHCIFAM